MQISVRMRCFAALFLLARSGVAWCEIEDALLAALPAEE